MELIEFIKKFLPDYEKKAKEHKEMGTIMPTRMIMFDEYYFPEALQNFADRICEKQKQKISVYFECFPLIAKGVLEVEQPKIEEL